MIKNKVLELFIGLMEEFILENGVREDSMVLEFIWLLMVSRNTENGLMEEEFVGCKDKRWNKLLKEGRFLTSQVLKMERF